jgi:hypothetical protein
MHRTATPLAGGLSVDANTATDSCDTANNPVIATYPNSAQHGDHEQRW